MCVVVGSFLLCNILELSRFMGILPVATNERNRLGVAFGFLEMGVTLIY